MSWGSCRRDGLEGLLRGAWSLPRGSGGHCEVSECVGECVVMMICLRSLAWLLPAGDEYVCVDVR